MAGEVRRTRTWLDVDRTGYWTRQMQAAHQTTRTGRGGTLQRQAHPAQASHALQKMAVAKARAGRRGGRGENRACSSNGGRLSTTARRPLLRQLDPMFFLVGQQLPKGVHALGESIKALQAYAEKGPHRKPPPPRSRSRGRRRAMSVSGSGACSRWPPASSGPLGGDPQIVARPQGRGIRKLVSIRARRIASTPP